MKKVYKTPTVSVIRVQAESSFMTQSDDWINSKKFKGSNFGNGSSFQTDGTFGGQKSPWEEEK